MRKEFDCGEKKKEKRGNIGKGSVRPTHAKASLYSSAHEPVTGRCSPAPAPATTPRREGSKDIQLLMLQEAKPQGKFTC